VVGLVYLKDGHGDLHEYSEELGGMHDTTLWDLVSVAFGDWDGDGQDEAIVLIRETYSAPEGPGSVRVIAYVYRELNAEVVQIGDALRLAQVKSAAIQRGYLTLSGPEGCAVYRLKAEDWVRQTEACPK